MRVKRFKNMLLVLACALAFQSCTEPGTSSTNFTMEVEPGTDQGGIIKWDEAYLHITAVNFTGERGSENVSTFTSTSIDFDLFADTKKFGGSTITAGSYENIMVRIEFDRAGTGEQGLLLKGDYNGTPVELHVNENVFAAGAATDADFPLDGRLTGTVYFNFETLTSTVTNLDLDNANTVNGKIIISKDPNLNIYNKFIDGLESAIRVEY